MIFNIDSGISEGNLMKSYCTICLLSALSIAALQSKATAEENGPYVSLLGGVNLLHTNEFEVRASDPVAAGFSSMLSTMHFDAGPMVGGAIGYEMGDFSVEGELSARRGKIDKQELPFGTIDQEGYAQAIALMGNGVYRMSNSSAFTPYLGVGAGVAFLSVRVTTPGAPETRTNDTVAAAQAFAGVSMAITEKADLGLEYRYFAAQRPNYEVDIGSADLGFNSSNVLLRLNWRFD